MSAAEAIPFSEEAISFAERTAAAASGQNGPLELLAAWLLIIGAVIVTSAIGTVATVVLVGLIIPILFLGLVWVVARNVAEQSLFGYSIQQVTIVVGPLTAIVALLAGSWILGLFALFATIAILAAG